VEDFSTRLFNSENYPGCWLSFFVQVVAACILGVENLGFSVIFYEQDCILINYNNSL
jgi:hypothetical protein